MTALVTAESPLQHPANLKLFVLSAARVAPLPAPSSAQATVDVSSLFASRGFATVFVGLHLAHALVLRCDGAVACVVGMAPLMLRCKSIFHKV